MKDFYELNEAPSAAQWRELFRLASAVYKLKPWDSMFESVMFGVSDAASGTIGYASVMGAIDEHFAVAFYLGGGAFNSIQSLMAMEEPPEMRDLLAIPQLQVSFEQRDDLLPPDLEAEKKYMIAKLGGRNSHIAFRAVRPYYHPWLITAEDAELLLGLLRPLVEILPRVIANPKNYVVEEGEEYELSCVHFVAEENIAKWREERRVVEDEFENEIVLEAPPEHVEAVRALPAGGTVEIAYADPGDIAVDELGRPFEPELMLIVDAETQDVLKLDVTGPAPGPEEYLAGRGALIADSFADLPYRPSVVRVDNTELKYRLEPFAEQVGFEIEIVDELPGIDAAVEDLQSRYDQNDLSLEE